MPDNYNEGSYGRDVKFYDSRYHGPMASMPFHIDLASVSPSVEAAGLSENPGGFVLGPRTISGYEFLCVVEGAYRIEMLDHEFALSPSDVFIMPPNVRHRYLALGQRAAHYYVYGTLSPDDRRAIDVRRGRRGLRFSDLSLSATYTGAIPFHLAGFPREKQYLFRAIVESRQAFQVHALAATELLLKERTLAMLRELLRFASGGHGEAFRESVRHIDAHYHRKITVADLAAREGLSPNYYSARFKAAYGIAPMEYCTMRRVNAAKDLIRSGLPMRDVAARTGFRDPYYFSNVFKKVAGMPPSQYRNLVRHGA